LFAVKTVKKIVRPSVKIFTLAVYSGASASHASEEPSSRENLVMTSAYEQASECPYRLGGGGAWFVQLEKNKIQGLFKDKN